MTAAPDETKDFWVFGYGSLMWRPDFPYTEAYPAVIHGYHRSLCIYSVRYRGTPECPGLVLGLDTGGSCNGRAFHVAAENAADVAAYLLEREMPTDTYRPSWVKTRLEDGRTVKAYTFVARHDHVQYAGKLSLDESVRLVRQGCGRMGPNIDYIRNTHDHLATMGITDSTLAAVLNRFYGND